MRFLTVISIGSAALFGCGHGFQTVATQAGDSISSSLADNFGAVQMMVAPAGGEIDINVGDTLNVSVIVATTNVIESASWEKFDSSKNTYATVPNTTISVDLSGSQTTDLLTLANIQTSASGTYRASAVIKSLDGTTTKTFTSDNVQVVVGGIQVAPTAAPTATPTAAPTATPKPTATPLPTPVQAGGTAKRPSYNTGTGFFVIGSKLYDSNGNEFRMRGVNRVHWDNGSVPGIVKSNANTVRMGNDVIQLDQYINNKLIPIMGDWAGTCQNDPSYLTSMTDKWVAAAPGLKPYEAYFFLNIANEWGPGNSSVWRDSYITSIKRIRAAGFLGTLVIDSGGCGQDSADILNYAAAVFASDPQKNIVFSVHVYGGWFDSTGGIPSPGSWATQTNDLVPGLTAIQKLGLTVIVGEFGPGRNIGPSPTMLTPARVIKTAESLGLGWLAWAWDDNNLAACRADDNWFSMTTVCGGYTQTSDLTTFGKDVVLNSSYGLQAIAKKASIFGN